MDTSFLINIAPFVAMFAIFYFLMIRPQQQRTKQLREAIDNARRGDTVVTSGGIVGRVARVKDDGEVMVEIADNVQVRVVKGMISEVRSKSAAPDAKTDKS
ncbi:MAG TPA: preprotein translocase subunit YajC [Rhizomicrobium sp.]|jgi:preprotein translocase subunit YajC|nr:preprotein translocase subunit YajC [Rhizomicrobium sp.]